MSFKRYNKSFKRDICCFDIRSNFLISISFPINIGKEMSLPEFRSLAYRVMQNVTELRKGHFLSVECRDY